MKIEFIEKFSRFVCVGDSISVDHNGITFTARIEHDPDSDPTECDCYDAEDIKRFRNDEWHYCGVVISIHKGGVLLPEGVSVWGVEMNLRDDNTYLDIIANDMLAEAIEMAPGLVEGLVEKLNA